MNRIKKKFDLLKSRNEKALITFITAGDPDIKTTEDMIFAMEDGGADIVEIGIPYSDPLADGPVIQNSSARSLKNGTKIKDIMNCIKDVRSKSDIPLVFLAYYNSLFKYGIERFISESLMAGIDGFIIPDLPIEEREELVCKLNGTNISLIPLVAPTSKERIKRIVESADTFVYCVSLNGVTGMREKISTDLKAYMETVKQFTTLPRALGFGISNPSIVKNVKDLCEGVVVGSAIVDLISKNADRGRKVKEFVSEMKGVLLNE
ncbi:MAG: tryptophan synthase subunit alpha [Mesoaciditoga sp.]|uniref:tryptophan synthase subunit alpha n=1 Tax=Athalassotoga sp. TaxID=2022597 RepID=UPI000CBCF965|nr:MAG: tryptophan synthase subunit alpha [Mesoaciditoga sp.]HEU23749.1 tryptophan synthase subunit alpha [Mesoaciditoga lauensis]